MTSALLIAIVATALQSAPVPVPPVPVPPPAVGRRIDWEALPPLPYREPPEITPAMVEFVAGEVASKRCAAPPGKNGKRRMQVDIAVLVTRSGTARVTIPRAIQCPTVEQYTAGLVLSFARDNLLPRASNTSQWYRATVTFEWSA